MKVKEAIAELQASSDPDSLYNRIRKLYLDETINRIKLRAHGSPTATVSLTHSVLKEMDEWIVKVARGVGMTDEGANRLLADEKKKFFEHMRFAVFLKRTGGEP